MNDSLDIKIKEQKEPTLWERFIQWLNGDDSEAGRPGLQAPKIGTNTEILLSQTQKIKLKNAVETPGQPSSDTTLVGRADSEQDSSQLFI